MSRGPQTSPSTPCTSGNRNYQAEQQYNLKAQFSVGNSTLAVENVTNTCGTDKSESDPENGGFSWQVEPGTTDLSVSNVYFLALGQTDNIDGSATTHYFNITANAADLPTSQSSSTTTSPTTAVASSTPASTTTTATNVSNAPQAGSSTSDGATIGLGVGLGVGIPIILLLAGLLFLKVRKDRGRQQNRTDTHETAPLQYPMNMLNTAANYSQQYMPQERPIDGYIAYELPVPSKSR
jgi:hypothetical protein